MTTDNHAIVVSPSRNTIICGLLYVHTIVVYAGLSVTELSVQSHMLAN